MKSGLLFGALSGVPRYSDRLKALFGTSILSYLPCTEASGTSLLDASGNARNATIGGTHPPVAGGVIGIGDGNLAVSFGGVSTSYIDWYSTSMRDAFDPLEGTLLLWLGGITSAVWDDGSVDYIFRAEVDASNYITIYKRSTPIREIIIRMVAGGTSIFRVIPAKNLSWFQFALTWSKSNNRLRGFINGKQYGADLAGLGTWSGTINADKFIIGGDYKTSTDLFTGTLAHALLLNREATPAEIQQAYDAFRTPLIIGAIGDSITAYVTVTSYSWMLRDQYNGGNCRLINHAVTGHSIMSNLDAQVTAAATDSANLIIIHIGTNDDNAGDMTALQAEVEENLIELKASNPLATIYVMNVLKRWTAVDGVTEVAKGNIRTAIAAACTAQSVTCWDTYTSTWIDAADTSDGLHPNDAGHAKILTQILARLP